MWSVFVPGISGPRSIFVAYFSELIQLKLSFSFADSQAIEDVRQETFARVFAALRSPGGNPVSPNGWARSVTRSATNVLLEHYRARRAIGSLEDEAETDLPIQSSTCWGGRRQANGREGPGDF